MNKRMSKSPVEYCCLNGKIMPTEEAKIPVTDIGILRGYAIFDSIAAMNGKIIFFDEHYKRFERSARIMHLRIPESKRSIEAMIYKLLRKNHYDSSRIKLVLTGGRLVGGLDYDVHSANLFILVQQGTPRNEREYREGAKLITYEHQREISAAKNNDYITAVNIQSLRRKAGAAEILYTFNGSVLEATTANFFMVKDDTLITPKEGILLGIVRGKVMGLARKFMKVEERAVSLSEMRTAHEAFITSTYRRVLPIVSIDNLAVGSGKVGRQTTLLMDLYSALEEKVCS